MVPDPSINTDSLLVRELKVAHGVGVLEFTHAFTHVPIYLVVYTCMRFCSITCMFFLASYAIIGESLVILAHHLETLPILATKLYRTLDLGAPYIGGTHGLFLPLTDEVGTMVCRPTFLVQGGLGFKLRKAPKFMFHYTPEGCDLSRSWHVLWTNTMGDHIWKPRHFFLKMTC